MQAVARRSLFLPLMASLTGLAWFTLWAWEQSPYGRYLNHGQWDQIGLRDSICLVLPAGEILLPGLLYVGGWTLMVAAMMLPTTLPLLEIFRRLTAQRADRYGLIALVIAGYLGTWGLFGVAAHVVDLGLHWAVQASAWLTFNSWVFGAGALGLAGLFQFSALKYRCLERCRTPLSFVIGHWRGGDARARAFALGVHHGAFCVGCCWALMLLMFAVGGGSVGWMLLLGAVMAVEKNLPSGRRISTPLGVGLIAWSAWIILDQGRFSSL